MSKFKIAEGLKDARKASVCAHTFASIKERPDGGIWAVCSECQCRITAWPGTVHYDEIVAARDRQRREAG